MDSKTKTKLITERLEKAFGIPKWKGKGKPLDSLILTILSQSTNDRNRDMAYTRLKERFPDWMSVMNAPVEKIVDAIRPAGLGNQKSVRIKDVLKWVYDTYGTFDLHFLCDRDPEEVIHTFLQLKGVGIKTISVVLMFTCGVDIFPVDTHVHRICRRLGLVPDKTSAEKTHHLMQSIVPAGKSYSLHMNFLKLGRTICLARKPKCAVCPVNTLCPSAQPD
ncbi:endonuclease III [candidate division KSB1 bacterium]|nr:endonuclease III [candidate division KSB1 bacterium]